ncbi:RNA methyltransferase [Aurantimonas sp. VKM B-3413]|uniref:TrmH family RNA methyltransferase n=1 Tax=Aurantimonas sp. VKM B-3413 TaxID=2779401 RepID=UPI001E5A7F2D|nr:RNA methyltransferase [Aurantimonas sp. VKM B-3413]MCB8839604.1 RNA methyltransferase [Aurantimonas sp. VKM B-3413]
MPDQKSPKPGGTQPGASARSPLRAPGRVKEVTSAANPLVKDIRALAQKKHREETGLFLVEGLKLVVDGLDAGWELSTLVIAKAAAGNQMLEKTAARAVASGADVIEASAKVLEAITRRDNPQNAAGVFRRRLAPLASLVPAAGNVTVVLDRVRDPGNLGTVLRTADAAGAAGLVLVGDTVDPFSLETVRATMGSIFAVPIARAREAEFLAWRKDFRGLVVGTHMRGVTDYRTPDYAGQPVLLVMGNEQAGLSDPMADACDLLVRIPQAGRADSLNLAVATGIMLFEVRRKALSL